MKKPATTEYRALRKEYDVLLKKIRGTSDPTKRNNMILEMDLLRARLRVMKYSK